MATSPRKKEPSRLSRWLSRTQDRLSRSSRVFLLGIVIACGIEVAVDLNQMIFEINVLRDRVRERAQSYVAVLAHGAEGALASHDAKAAEALSSGLFDDEDVVFVRFVDADGHLVHEKILADYDGRFLAERGERFAPYYAHQMERDLSGIVKDPVTLRKLLAASRYKDFVQTWNDFVDGLVARFVSPKPKRAQSEAMYQDRLRTKAKLRDEAVTYAVAASARDGKPVGAVLVAFSMDRTNAGIRGKQWKAIGEVIFFVALILVQNVVGRRDKLRLLDLEKRYAAAQQALRDVLPPAMTHGGCTVAGAISQAAGAVDGAAFDHRAAAGVIELLGVDPDGDGIDAAAVTLHVLSAFRARDVGEGTPEEVVAALGSAALGIPLTRPISLFFVRLDVGSGEIAAIASRDQELRIAADGETQPLSSRPVSPVPEGVSGPLSMSSGMLHAGATLLAFRGGDRPVGEDVVEVGKKVIGALRRDGPVTIEAIAAFLGRDGREDQTPVAMTSALDDAITWARGRTVGSGQDLMVVGVRRA